MNAEDLKKRTKAFVLNIFRLIDTLPEKKAGYVVGNQLLRSASSVGANYRSACRARSQADFISKITIVEEEADESAYWLEIISEAELSKSPGLLSLLKEANELTAIFTAAGKTAKANKNNLKSVPNN